MPTPYDIPPSLFIERLARYLRNNVDEVQPSSSASLTKTGSHTQRQPQDSDWWFTRSASILRKTYLDGPVGVERLRTKYGGRKSLGVKRQHTRKGGGSNVRKILQQLEAAGLIEKTKNDGRIVTAEGRRTLDRLASELRRELEKSQPELKKYP